MAPENGHGAVASVAVPRSVAGLTRTAVTMALTRRPTAGLGAALTRRITVELDIPSPEHAQGYGRATRLTPVALLLERLGAATSLAATTAHAGQTSRLTPILGGVPPPAVVQPRLLVCDGLA